MRHPACGSGNTKKHGKKRAFNAACLVNNAGVAAFVKILATDKLALTVALLGLVNTVKDSLLPVFTQAEKSAKKLAETQLASLEDEKKKLAEFYLRWGKPKNGSN